MEILGKTRSSLTYIPGINFIDSAIKINPNDNECFNIKANLYRAMGKSEDDILDLYLDEDDSEEESENVKNEDDQDED